MTDNQPSYHYNVGTEVSAKYRGAFCEAMIKTVKKNVIFNVRVSNMKKAKCYGLTDEQIRGSHVVGATVKALFPGQLEWRDGVITGVKDKSIYTVEFNDGDVRSLPRRYLCLQGVRHFPESDSLDHLPLTDPENFGTPVLSGKQRKTKRKRLSFDSDSDDVTPTNYSSSKRKNSTGDEYDEEEDDEIEVKMKSDKKNWLNDKMLGKLVLAQTDENVKKFVAVVVNPTIHEDYTDMDSLSYLVRSFVTGKFHVVSRTSTTLLTPGHLPSHLDTDLKEEIEEAFRWQGNGQIPLSWRSEDDIISPINVVEDTDEVGNTNQEEKNNKIKNKLFLDVLYKFMEDCETPIIKTPVLGYKDLDLYQLYLEVKKRGGWSNINKTSQWVEIYESMGIPMHSSTGRQRVRRAYEKYLLRFERYLQTFPVCPITIAAATMRKQRKHKRRVSPSRATTSSSATSGLPGGGERRADGDYRQGDVVLTRCEQFDGNLYEAKIIRVGDDDDVNRFLIHYCGWNKRHDEWIDRNKIVRLSTTMTSSSDGGCHDQHHYHHHRSSSCETDNEYHHHQHRGVDGSTSRFHPRHHTSMHYRARSEENPPTSSMSSRHLQPTSSKPITSNISKLIATTNTSSVADNVLMTSSFDLSDKTEKFVAKVSTATTTSVVVTSGGGDMTSYDATIGLLDNHDDDDEIARICSHKNAPDISTSPTMTPYHETKSADITIHGDDYKVYNDEELRMERDFSLNIQLPHDHDVNELEGNIEDEVRFESAQIVIDQLAASNIMKDESCGSFASMETSTDDVITRDSGFKPINNMTSSSDDNCDDMETIECKNAQQKDDIIMTQWKGADENCRPATAPPATTTVESEEMRKKEVTMMEENKIRNKRPKRRKRKKERMPELPPPITDEDLEHLTNEQRIDLLEKRQQLLRKIWSKYRSSIQRLDRERRKFIRKKADGACSGN